MKPLFIIGLIVLFFLPVSCHRFDYETNFIQGGTLTVQIYTSAGTTSATNQTMLGIYDDEAAMLARQNPPWGGQATAEGGTVTHTFDSDKELYIGGFHDSNGNNTFDVGIDPSNGYSGNPVTIEKNETVTISIYIIN